MKTPKLTDAEQVRLGLLLARREKRIVGLRNAIARSADDKTTDAAAAELIESNAALMAFVDGLQERGLYSETDGFVGGKSIAVNPGVLDPENLFSWETEVFLTANQWEFDEGLVGVEELLAEPVERSDREYLEALKHAAKTGWPSLTRRQRVAALRAARDMRAALEVLEVIA